MRIASAIAIVGYRHLVLAVESDAMVTEDYPATSVVTVARLPRHPGLADTDEINHRIANSLQLIAAMVSLEARGLADAAGIAALEKTRRRIGAVASVHRQLCRSRRESTVNLGAYLIELGQNLQDACADASTGRCIQVSAVDVWVSSIDATSVGIIVSELVTNACKHAYPQGTRGTIRIILERAAGIGFKLVVEDGGEGVAHTADHAGPGLGHRLIDMMAAHLGARQDWEDACPGTRYVLHVAR